MTPHPDDDLLRLISEVHGQTPGAAEEASLARAVDHSERTGRLAAQKLAALTHGRSRTHLGEQALGRQEPEPEPVIAQAPEQPAQTDGRNLPSEPTVRSELRVEPEAFQAEKRELTRHVRNLPGGHAESGSGRPLKAAGANFSRGRDRSDLDDESI